MESRDSAPVAEFCALTPCYAQRVLYVGKLMGRARWKGYHRDLRVQRNALLLRHSLPPATPYDFVVFDEPIDSPALLASLLDAVLPALPPHGVIAILPRAHEAEPSSLTSEEAAREVAARGLLLYTWEPRNAPDFPKNCALLLMRETYDPVLHARELAQAGHPDWSILVLHQVPAELVTTEETRARISAERLRYYVELDDRFGHAANDFTTLTQAQKDFYIAVYTLPHLHAAYRNMAELWRRFGSEHMAARLLRSVLHAKPDHTTQQKLATLTDTRATVVPEQAPEWTGRRQAPRVLIVTHDYSDYGMDTLYDGLCSVIGANHVAEFPWKPMLHGQNPDGAVDYPCVFDHPGAPKSPEVVEEELAGGEYDLILFADVVQNAYKKTVRRFLKAAPGIPVVVYDTWDNPHNLLPTALEYLGVERVAAYFKREMLACCDYGPNAFPLPFGYPDRLVPEEVSTDRPLDLFWAGKRLFGTRTLYLGHLDTVFNRRFDARYTQAEYARTLDSARMGLSFFGFGFDTVRYWELPAHGCLLFAERPPIRIPYDFEDGVSAVFFDDLPELERKLKHYLAHPDDAARIASAGREHFLRYHTASARARQFLGILERVLAW